MYSYLCSWRWWRCIYIRVAEGDTAWVDVSLQVRKRARYKQLFHLMCICCLLPATYQASAKHLSYILLHDISVISDLFFFSLINLLMLFCYCLLPFIHLFLISPQALPWTQIPQSDEMNKIVTFVFRNTMQKERRKKSHKINDKARKLRKE